MKQFNVIEDNEDYLGKPEELINMFLYEIGRTAKDETLSEEERIYNIGLMVDISKDIQNYENNVVLRIKYNPMGSFYIADL